MTRLMSVAYTEDAVRARQKTVTRRKGWWTDKNGRLLLKPGDRLTLVRKAMGLRKGESIVRVTEVEVVDVRRELLGQITWDPEYGRTEVALEGFPGMEPAEFVRRFFTDAQRMTREDEVTRIEWRYLDGES